MYLLLAVTIFDFNELKCSNERQRGGGKYMCDQAGAAFKNGGRESAMHRPPWQGIAAGDWSLPIFCGFK